MKIVYAGAPEFSVAPLKSLTDAGFCVVAVVTQPDKPVGRKAVLTPTNAQWDSLALYRELCKEREAIAHGAASVHAQAEEKA